MKLVARAGMKVDMKGYRCHLHQRRKRSLIPMTTI